MLLELTMMLALAQDPKAKPVEIKKAEPVNEVTLQRKTVQDLTILDLQSKLLEKDFKIAQVEIEARQAEQARIRQSLAENGKARGEAFAKAMKAEGVDAFEIPEFQVEKVDPVTGKMTLKRKPKK